MIMNTLISKRHDIHVGPKTTSLYARRCHGKSEISHFCQIVKTFGRSTTTTRQALTGSQAYVSLPSCCVVVADILDFSRIKDVELKCK